MSLHRVNPDLSDIYLFVITFFPVMPSSLGMCLSSHYLRGLPLLPSNSETKYLIALKDLFLNICTYVIRTMAFVQFLLPCGSYTLNPDSISCNQVHHLHFFPRYSFLNLPRVSIDNISAYEDLRRISLGDSQLSYLFPCYM